MCDYDTDWENIRSKVVVTRKAHDCDSCLQIFPAKTRMVYHIGKSEGELSSLYCCRACAFALHQVDHTELHLCWGWAWGDYSNEEYPDGKETWNYINTKLSLGEIPTVEGVRSHLSNLAKSDEE